MKIDITKNESLALKAVCAFGVFLCHCFPTLNIFGFCFVGVFFFLSGYAMEKKHLQKESLYRVGQLMIMYLIPCLIACCIYQDWICFKQPIYWYCVEWSVFMFFYRFFAQCKPVLFLSGFAFLIMVYLLEFNFVWYASGWLFFIGILGGRNENNERIFRN